jgi:hypothetical protein
MRRLQAMLLAALIVLSSWAKSPTPGTGTIKDLANAVRSGMQARQSDEQIAHAIEMICLAERLDDEVIDYLQFEGAGKLATDALERQRDVSHGLPHPTARFRPGEAPAAPSAKEQLQLINHARAWAMQYEANSPNFLCSEEVSRYAKHKDPAQGRKRNR